MQKFKENILLSQYSNYKIGGPARFFFEPKNQKEMAWAVMEAGKRKLPLFILGGGTNLLMDDNGFAGLVLHPRIKTLKEDGVRLTVGAGVPMEDLLKFAAKKSLSGLEWAGGLPGTLGGAVCGNAGCFGGEIKDIVASVKSFDTKTMKVVRRLPGECGFRYRTSIFKKMKGREIILETTLRFAKGDRKKITQTIREKIEHRMKNHPLEHPNIGSIFKNVPLHAIHPKNGRRYRDAVRALGLEYRGSKFSVKTDPFPVISAAKLISESGLRGVSFGGAMISAKHPNFIVNVLGARSFEVKNLIQLAKTGVRKKFNVELEEEIQLI